MDEPAQVRDNAPKPEGLLPKNVQSWLLVGLALLMVAIMWLTGGRKPQAPKSTPAVAPAERPLEVDQTKIEDLQSRIEQLQRQQLVAQSALAQQTRLLSAAAEPPGARPQTDAAAAPEARPEDTLGAEEKRRSYLALFASNVALSYRENLPDTARSGVLPRSASAPAESDRQTESSSPIPGPSSRTEPKESSLEAGGQKEAGRHAATPPPGPGNPDAAGPAYILFEGTILEAVLLTRLDGQFAGPVECMLSSDVYSNDREHLLIPAGSKLLGETKKVDAFGQSRLAVVFHRLIMPDGYSVSLDQFKGLNAEGDAGLRDQVNNHYLRIFGVSLAIGAIGAVAEGESSAALNASSSDLMRQGFAQSTAQSSAQILDKFLNIMPTVTIREGHRVKVYLEGDLVMPAYNNHQMPSDL